jgi:hypothetical protein
VKAITTVPPKKTMKPTKTSKLPKQAAPVQRPSTSAAMSNQNGVEASGIFDLMKYWKFN